ncbi:hypothetical protein SAMN04487787_104317 [Kosakonia sacchari]|nr:hypothetical protein SAMN04487787_104317 [Kosakonia sacchari]
MLLLWNNTGRLSFVDDVSSIRYKTQQKSHFLNGFFNDKATERKRLLDILNLLAHLLNQHFQFNSGIGDFSINRLGCQRV